MVGGERYGAITMSDKGIVLMSDNQTLRYQHVFILNDKCNQWKAIDDHAAAHRVNHGER